MQHAVDDWGPTHCGMHVAPVYEGWTRNDDGTIDLWFGFLNRNWEEVLHVPVGPANRIEPDGPDRGQPTVFVPRRRFGRAVQCRETMVFSVRVPSDWTSEDEVDWTVRANGKTDRAIGLFLPIHELPGPVNLESLTTASFSEPGTFLLRAVAYDGDWYDSRNVTVTVTE